MFFIHIKVMAGTMGSLSHRVAPIIILGISMPVNDIMTPSHSKALCLNWALPAVIDEFPPQRTSNVDLDDFFVVSLDEFVHEVIGFSGDMRHLNAHAGSLLWILHANIWAFYHTKYEQTAPILNDTFWNAHFVHFKFYWGMSSGWDLHHHQTISLILNRR